MTGETTEGSPGSRAQIALVNAFVAFHLVAIAAWLAPAGWTLRDHVAGLVGPYLRATGLAQQWMMFAPNPPRANPVIEARLRFADGRERTVALPTLDGHLERTQKWRLRRWTWDLVLRDQPGAWADAARWAVVTHGLDPRDPAVAVAVTCRLEPIAPPGSPPAAGPRGTTTTMAAFDVRPGGAR